MITSLTRYRSLPFAPLAAAVTVVGVAVVVINITVTRGPGAGMLSNGSPPGGAAYAGMIWPDVAELQPGLQPGCTRRLNQADSQFRLSEALTFGPDLRGCAFLMAASTA